MQPPIYQKLVELLKEEIASKCPNEPILSERELATVFQVSRMTARRAVDCLVEEGYVYRLKNKGTFVADSSLRKTQKVYLPSNHIKYRTLYFNVKEAGDEIAQKLNILSSELIVIVMRMQLENNLPQCIDEIYFVKKYLSNEDLNQMRQLLSLDLYIEKQRLLQSFYPINVPVKYAKLLDLPQQTPIIKIENVIRNQLGIATLFFISYLNPNQKTIQIDA